MFFNPPGPPHTIRVNLPKEKYPPAKTFSFINIYDIQFSFFQNVANGQANMATDMSRFNICIA